MPPDHNEADERRTLASGGAAHSDASAVSVTPHVFGRSVGVAMDDEHRGLWASRWLSVLAARGWESLVAVALMLAAGAALAGCSSSVMLVVQPGHPSRERPRSDAGTAAGLARGHWSVLARSPLGERLGPTVIWDGRELLELGGIAVGAQAGAPKDSGAAYDPSRGRWRRVASAPAAVLPAGAASVWTGREVFLFGGPTLIGEAATDVAGLYDPTTNRWTVSRKAPFGPLNQPTAVWTGTKVILAGLLRPSERRLEVASYDPAANTWTSLDPPIRRGHPPLAIAMVDTNDGVLLWSLWGRAKQIGHRTFTEYSGVDVYRLGSSGRWRNVTGSWPQHQTVDTPIFTGTRILLAPGQIWCGSCSHPPPFGAHGYLVDPKTLRLTAVPHGPLDDLGPQIVWTGAAQISLNAGGIISGPHQNVRPGDIAIWNPNTAKWSRPARAPKPLGSAPAIWSGQALFVLGSNGHLLDYGG